MDVSRLLIPGSGSAKELIRIRSTGSLALCVFVSMFCALDTVCGLLGARTPFDKSQAKFGISLYKFSCTVVSLKDEVL